jgi:rubrerythrin
MDRRCPLCGTSGKLWHKDPAIFRCPNCSSIFSQFGMVIEKESEFLNLWA